MIHRNLRGKKMHSKAIEEVFFLVFVEIFMLFIFRALLPANNSELYFAAKTALYSFDIIFVFIMVKVFDHEKLSFIGLTKNNLWDQFKTGLVIFLLLIYLYIFPYYLVYGISLPYSIETGELLLHVIVNIFVISVAEEMLFRGLILARLKTLLSSDTKVIIVSALIFGLSQYPLSHNALKLIFYVYMGLILSIMRLKFDSKIISLSLAHGLMLSVFDFISCITV